MITASTAKEILFRSDWMAKAVRSISSLIYLGPWRDPLVGVMSKIHRSRKIATDRESSVVEIDRKACSDRLLRSGFSGTFRFSQELIDQIVAEIPADFSGKASNLHLKSAAIRKIAFDPVVVSLVTEYLGVAPYLFQTELTAYNTMARRQLEPGETCTKKFHYDVSDFRSLTLFVYLNDIEPDGGAHVLIPATHRSIPLSKYGSRFLSYSDARNLYGEDRMVSITGEKGTAFLEDLVNWHKRSMTNKGRYCLSVTYNLNRTS
jgi:hypothetical protein